MIEIIHGDIYDLKYTINYSGGSPADLRCCTQVLLKILKKGNSVIVVSGIVTDAPKGMVSFPIDGTLPLGKYKGEIQMTFVYGEVVTASNLKINVIANLED